MLQTEICDTLCSFVPGAKIATQTLIFSAQAFRFGMMAYRRIQMVENPTTARLFALGSCLQSWSGNHRLVQQVAGMVFGGLSLVRCVDDLQKLKEAAARFKTLRSLQERYSLLKDCCRLIQELSCHLYDTYAAYGDDTSPEVLVHAYTLWNELSSTPHQLKTQWEKACTYNIKLFEKKGYSGIPFTATQWCLSQISTIAAWLSPAHNSVK